MRVSPVLDLFITLLLLITPACLAASTTPAPVTCAPNYYGPPPSCTPCGQCASSPQCDVSNGNCPNGCQAGYMPPTCKTVCSPGHYGTSCSSTCGLCKEGEVCNRVNGSCTQCRENYKLPLCTACLDGYYGTNCSSKCGLCKEGEVCNKTTGYCTQCRGNYKPPMCTVCSDGFYDNSCSNTCGQCQKGEICNKATGSCTQCLDNYQLPLCKDCLAGQWGPSCGQRCGQCGEDGQCNRATGECLKATCLDGWTGASCSLKCAGGSYGPNCSNSCGNCRGNTNCRHDNGLCEAGCNDGFEGVLCDKERVDIGGAVAGSVMGAAVLIAAAVVGTLLFIHFRSRRLKSAAKGVRHDGANDSLENAGYSNSTRSTPGEALFYDPVDPRKRDFHLYEGQVQSGHNVALPMGSTDISSGDATYQNLELHPETPKHPKGKRYIEGSSAGLPENLYGNT